MTPLIEAYGLTKRFAKTKALDGLDLVAERGQVFAVLGPNGAGKTTFVRAIAMLLRPDSGSLHVWGHDVRKHPDTVRRLIGLAGQFAAVEPAMTGRENVSWSPASMACRAAAPRKQPPQCPRPARPGRARPHQRSGTSRHQPTFGGVMGVPQLNDPHGIVSGVATCCTRSTAILTSRAAAAA